MLDFDKAACEAQLSQLLPHICPEEGLEVPGVWLCGPVSLMGLVHRDFAGLELYTEILELHI